MEGWIKLHRKIQENWLWQENRKFSKFEAWISLLLKANHKENKVMIGNEVINISSGSFITSEMKLSEEWKWSRTTVRNFLKILENDKMIVKNHTTKYTSISIENWELYQFEQQQNEQQKNNERTTKKQQKNTNKNVKNENNIYYGEYGNVFFTEKQYKDLQKEFPQDYKDRIQQLDDYIQSTGKKYKDCLATIRTWARKNGYVKPTEKEEMVYVENTMTEEEYFAKVRGLKNV